jgi:hypothetical protein
MTTEPTMGDLISRIGPGGLESIYRTEREASHREFLSDTAESLQSLLDGSGTYAAIQDTVKNLRELAPEDHDTLIASCGLIIDEVGFKHPHTIVLGGMDERGDRSSIVAHFTQIMLKVVYLPRAGRTTPREVGFHAI